MRPRDHDQFHAGIDGRRLPANMVGAVARHLPQRGDPLRPRQDKLVNAQAAGEKPPAFPQRPQTPLGVERQAAQHEAVPGSACSANRRSTCP